MYRRPENKWGTVILVSLLGLSNIGLIANVITRNKFPVMNLPVGPYTSYKVIATEKGYTVSYKANDPAILINTSKKSSPKGLFGNKEENIHLYEENTMLGRSASGNEEGLSDELIACIKTEGSGESTGKLVGASIGAKAAPTVSQIPIVGWLAAGWVTMFGANKGGEVGGEIAKSFNNC
tara:strand:- start:122 stop:658 length:537 start_codon:yes stop_codon:yes gene_type:complete